MWRVIDFFATVIDRFVFAIKNFKKNPIDSLGVLLPFAMNLIGFVATMVPYSAFLLNGCYADQIEILNAKGENSLSRIKEIATPYEADLDAIYLIVTKVVVLLLVGQLIVIMIAYFKRESKVLKVLMKIDMIIFAMAHVLRLVINALVDSLGLLSENEQEKTSSITPINLDDDDDEDDFNYGDSYSIF